MVSIIFIINRSHGKRSQESGVRSQEKERIRSQEKRRRSQDD
ncbi:hypothetical protein [Dolichospermum sp. UHCC 0259]|nr:hypothetical protein [Dolichospermum sp. UHCC 0259]